jgi:hypothetical protein
MKTTTYRGILIEHPTLPAHRIIYPEDAPATMYHIPEMRCELSKLTTCKEWIDDMYAEMEAFNEECPEEYMRDIHEWLGMYAEHY